MFDRYVPDSIFEMKKSFSHITPLATMNFVTTLVNILEGVLTPANINNKAEQVSWHALCSMCHKKYGHVCAATATTQPPSWRYSLSLVDVGH